MGPTSDGQLKLAVLAVDRGLATVEQVYGAVARWVADPSRSLADWMERSGALSAEARSQLEQASSGSPSTLDDPTLPSQARLRRPANFDSPDALVTPECPDRYELKGPRGEGGQARIFVALDRHLGREVALKEFTRDDTQAPGDPSSATSLDRFLREARVTGQLEHPSIVPVYELGRRPDGAFYYTMRLVNGRTLSAALQGKDLGERLRLLGHFRDVCHALAFAHSRGVIHRDVKPSNVMVGEFGETVLLDWGIAKIRGVDDGRTRELERRLAALSRPGGPSTLTGGALGTPSYMSPEQAEGRVAEVDERSDVWGLGAVLYALLTGVPPFRGESDAETLQQVIRSELVPVRQRVPEVPAELAAIAEKALSKRREDRYATASEVAAEVTAYMSGLRVAAYAYSRWELARRFAVRHAMLLAALGAIFAATVTALVVTRSALAKESAALEREQAARSAEGGAHRVAHYHLAQAYAREAVRLSDERAFFAARLFAAASLNQNPAHPGSLDPDPAFAQGTPDAAWLRVDALSLLFQTRTPFIERLSRTIPLEESIYRVAFSPDGRLLAAADVGGRLSVFSADDGSPVLSSSAGEVLRTLAFTPDSKLLLTAGAGRAVKVWDLATRTQTRVLPAVPGAIHALAVSPSGRLVAVGDQAGAVHLFDLKTGEALHLPVAHTQVVRDLAFSPDGTRLASASWDKTGVVWDVASRTPRARLTGHADSLYGVAFSPDGTRLVTVAHDRTVRLWDPASGAPKGRLDRPNESYAVAFSPDGKLLATADMAGALEIFDAGTQALLASTPAHDGSGATSVAFHPGGGLVATAGMDRAVRLWKLAPDRGETRLPHDDWVYGFAWSPDGKLLATGSWDGKVRIWDVQARAVLAATSGHTAGVLHLAGSHDGTLLASSSFDGTVRVWDFKTGAAVRTMKPERGAVRASSFSPDDRLLAVATAGAAVLVYELASGKQIALLEHAPGTVYGVAFSPDGKLLATAGQEKAVRLWSAADWSPVGRLEGHTDWSSGLGWSPDGKLLASSGKDGQVLLWDPAQGKLLAKLSGHQSWIDDVAFSPDGTRLASAGEDSRVIVWDVASRVPLLRLRTTRESMRSRFSPDGRDLAVADHFDAVLYRLELPFEAPQPSALLQNVEKQSGLELKGFDIALAPLSRPSAAAPRAGLLDEGE